MRHMGWVAAVLPLSVAACSQSNPTPSMPVTDGRAPQDAAPQPASPYTQMILQNAHIGSDPSKSDFQAAIADVALSGGPFASVRLTVDLVSPCFPWTNWARDPPPPGQNWPADCDAFDRNFEVSLIDPSAPQGTQALELVRAITPFGGPEHVEQDATDVFNTVHGPRTLRVYISAYSDAAGRVSGTAGAWYVSARLDVAPGPPPSNVLAAIPLYYGSVTAGQVVSDVTLTVPQGATSSRLEYRVTGHGGTTGDGGVLPSCTGPADEFCRRLHHVYLDHQEIEQITPWRSNCDTLCALTDGGPFGAGQYCQQNPCGAPSSVVASRANWCPGSVTPPLSWTPAALSSPGAHTFGFAVDGIAAGATWRVSAVAFVYGP
jgi:Peptide-N-glycosidase F, C terminal